MYGGPAILHRNIRPSYTGLDAGREEKVPFKTASQSDSLSWDVQLMPIGPRHLWKSTQGHRKSISNSYCGYFVCVSTTIDLGGFE